MAYAVFLVISIFEVRGNLTSAIIPSTPIPADATTTVTPAFAESPNLPFISK